MEEADTCASYEEEDTCVKSKAGVEVTGLSTKFFLKKNNTFSLTDRLPLMREREERESARASEGSRRNACS